MFKFALLIIGEWIHKLIFNFIYGISTSVNITTVLFVVCQMYIFRNGENYFTQTMPRAKSANVIFFLHAHERRYFPNDLNTFTELNLVYK